MQQIFNFEKIQALAGAFFANSGALIPNMGLIFYVHEEFYETNVSNFAKTMLENPLK